MWKLKVSEGREEWEKSVNNHVGRQFWEWDSNPNPNHATYQVEKLRQT